MSTWLYLFIQKEDERKTTMTHQPITYFLFLKKWPRKILMPHNKEIIHSYFNFYRGRVKRIKSINKFQQNSRNNI